ncbi:hypothetical protein [Bacteroides neonati]|uniref:hypothetical protein n=1 Tax=Bacteroides neonati TaxID=1347393 RepID=UPI0004AF902B|nr:hypothetical protein [Bacteroides neonati]
MTATEIDILEKAEAQLQAFYTDFNSLNKKPNDAISEFKLKLINRVIIQANELLGAEYKPFDEFDADAIPSNSDVVMILGQYLNCIDKLRSDNAKSYGKAWYWIVDGIESKIRTKAPKNRI